MESVSAMQLQVQLQPDATDPRVMQHFGSLLDDRAFAVERMENLSGNLLTICIKSE